MNRLFQEQHSHSESYMTDVCLEERNKLRFVLQKQAVVLRFLVQTSVTFLKVSLTMNSGLL